MPKESIDQTEPVPSCSRIDNTNIPFIDEDLISDYKEESQSNTKNNVETIGVTTTENTECEQPTVTTNETGSVFSFKKLSMACRKIYGYLPLELIFLPLAFFLIQLKIYTSAIFLISLQILFLLSRTYVEELIGVILKISFLFSSTFYIYFTIFSLENYSLILYETFQVCLFDTFIFLIALMFKLLVTISGKNQLTNFFLLFYIIYCFFGTVWIFEKNSFYRIVDLTHLVFIVIGWKIPEKSWGLLCVTLAYYLIYCFCLGATTFGVKVLFRGMLYLTN